MKISDAPGPYEIWGHIQIEVAGTAVAHQEANSISVAQQFLATASHLGVWRPHTSDHGTERHSPRNDRPGPLMGVEQE